MEKSNSFNSRLKEINFVVGQSSSKGVLAKSLDGEYLYKTGSFVRPRFSVIEPVVECICSDIIDVMSIPHAEYELEKVLVTPNNLWKKQEVVCCKSKLFTTPSIRFISGKVYTKNKKDYNYIISSLGEEFKDDINNMIIFDYLVNNTDRHHNNFGLVINEKNGSVEFAPLFDHGFSLCSDFDDDYLKSENIEDVLLDCDYSKLCCGCNYDQLKLIESCSCNLDFTVDELFLIVDKYSKYLPEFRVTVMKELLNYRYTKLMEELKWKGII